MSSFPSLWIRSCYFSLISKKFNQKQEGHNKLSFGGFSTIFALAVYLNLFITVVKSYATLPFT